jgi:hypothetical protein
VRGEGVKATDCYGARALLAAAELRRDLRTSDPRATLHYRERSVAIAEPCAISSGTSAPSGKSVGSSSVSRPLLTERRACCQW